MYYLLTYCRLNTVQLLGAIIVLSTIHSFQTGMEAHHDELAWVSYRQSGGTKHCCMLARERSIAAGLLIICSWLSYAQSLMSQIVYRRVPASILHIYGNVQNGYYPVMKSVSVFYVKCEVDSKGSLNFDHSLFQWLSFNFHLDRGWRSEYRIIILECHPFADVLDELTNQRLWNFLGNRLLQWWKLATPNLSPLTKIYKSISPIHNKLAM